MRKLILIIAIMLCCSVCKSQDTLQVSPVITMTSDSLIFHYPVIYTNFELPTLWERQIKEKSSPRLGLKAKIAVLVSGCIAWSVRNDKAAHLFLSYGVAELCGTKFAAGFMLAIECTQADIFGMEGRWEDTAADLFVDGIGIIVAWKVDF